MPLHLMSDARRLRTATALAAALLGGLLMLSCNGPRYQKHSTVEAALPRAVRTVHPAGADGNQAAGPLTGILRASVSSPLAFQTSGRVLRVLVEEGDRVKAGQLLAELDGAMQSAQLTQAQGVLAQARANLALLEAGSRPQEIAEAQAQLDSALAVVKQAEADFARAAQLFAEGVIARAQLDQAESAQTRARQAAEAARQSLSIASQGARPEQLEQARAAELSASGALAAAQTQLGYTRLTAPAAGTVTLRQLEAGQTIAAGSPVLELSGVDKLEIHTTIPDGQLTSASVGQAASVEFPALPGVRASARVLRINPQAEPRTRGFPLVLSLDPAEGTVEAALQPGIVAVVKLQSSDRPPGLRIPRRCLVNDAVFLVREGQAHRQPVELLTQDGEFVQVDGLQASDELILSGQEYVSEGESVRVVASLGIDELTRLSEDE